MNNLKEKIFSGVVWTTLESVINRGFDLFIQLFLARLLFPEDYGIVGMAAVFISLIQVFNDLGLGAALIQKKKELLTPLHYDTAFWSGIGWSILLFILVCFVATPLIASFYGVEQLNEIIPYMSLTILLSPINLVHRSQLTKEMQFKKLAFINSVSNIVAGSASLIVAFYGAGVWALVLYSVAKVIIAVPLCFMATRWIPRLRWDKACFKEIFGFGMYTTGTSIANVFAQKVDYLLVGKFVGASALGFYTFAFLLTNVLRTQIVGVINKVVYPVYVTLQDDPKQLLGLYLKILSINMLVIYPVIAMLFLFSEYLIPVFFGAKWDDAIILIKILAIAVVFQMMVNSNQSVFRAYGKVKTELKLQFIKSFLLYVPLIFVGVYYYDVLGAAIGFGIATLLSVFVTLFYLNKLLGLQLKQLVKVMKIPMLMLVVCGGGTYALLQVIDWRICLGVFIISVLALYSQFTKKEVAFFVGLLKKRKTVSAKENTQT